MSKWYYEVEKDLNNIAKCIEHYEREIKSSKTDLQMKGQLIEKQASLLPSLFEKRFGQLQEIEAILEYLNIRLKKERSKSFKKFLETYPRALTSADCNKYVDGDDNVVNMALIVNEFALLRNKFLAVHKGLEQKSWMISHITRLRCAGLDDAAM